MAEPISAYMLTCNNARTVRTALASLSFVDEIVVVDSGSTDDTLTIVKQFTDRIIPHPWPGFRDQYQFASEQCRHPWALFIDADEEISPELAAEMRERLAANERLPAEQQIKGFYGPRRTFFMDRWILHGTWASDREIRLYHRDCGRWEGGLHATIHVRGPTARCRHFYYHYTYDNLADQLRTLDRYSTSAAEDALAANERFSWFKLLTRPPARFLTGYLLRRGFLDGFPGLVIAFNEMGYVFSKHAKLWELRRCTPERIVAGKTRKP